MSHERVRSWGRLYTQTRFFSLTFWGRKRVCIMHQCRQSMAVWYVFEVSECINADNLWLYGMYLRSQNASMQTIYGCMVCIWGLRMHQCRQSMAVWYVFEISECINADNLWLYGMYLRSQNAMFSTVIWQIVYSTSWYHDMIYSVFTMSTGPPALD
jgi:hypothetical protein